MEGHSYQRQSELFELLDRLQSSRLNDQRCELPSNFKTSSVNNGGSSQSGSSLSSSDSRQMASKQMLQRILKHPPPYPMVALIHQGSHWIEPDHHKNSHAQSSLGSKCPRFEDAENEAKLYRLHFSGYEHFNFCASDPENGGQIVLSVKVTSDENNNNEDDEKYVRIIWRSIDKTVSQMRRLSDLASSAAGNAAGDGTLELKSPNAILEAVMTQVGMPPAMPVMFPGISDLITHFDEHGLSNTFKFGIIYQKFGQCTEEAIFGNQTHSPAMAEFMELLGQKVRLCDHEGYRGGLDTRHGQTGTHALYEKYQGNEIMFHVSTWLPYVESDDQQLQRKCHIGNDIVSIVFQEVNTPFAPDMIASHFLHAYIVVQPIDPCTSITRYRVSVVAQKDVPTFGPPLPSAAIFDKGLAFKDFLLSKLIQGERACAQAPRFQSLHQRTRATLLSNLAKELREQTVEYINANYQSSNSSLNTNSASLPYKSPSPSSSRIFTSVKRALKHVGSTKHELNRHVSSGSLSEVSLVNASTTQHSSSSENSSKKNSSTNSTSTSSEDSSVITKADSGHGDSDGSLPSSPPLLGRKKLLSSSQPHLAVLNDHHHNHQVHHTMIDTSSVEADDIIYSRGSSQGAGQAAKSSRQPILQLTQKKLDPDCQTVISGSVTTIPVGGSPTGSSSSLPLTQSSVSTHSNTSSSNSSCVAQAHAPAQHRLHQDISRLRVDKLELLRQALSAQHEVRQLRQREAQLETDLALAAAEIRRLQTMLKTTCSQDKSELSKSKSSTLENNHPQSVPPNLRPRRTTVHHMHIPL